MIDQHMRRATISTSQGHSSAESQSLHGRILNDVRENIVSGEWPPGFRIPFEADLAKQYGCSRMTVNKALTQLTRSGFLVRNRKSGTYVKAPQSLSAALEITNIQTEVEAAGKSYSYRLLNDSRRDATQIDQDLMAEPALHHVRDIQCLHEADGKPFCFEQRLINKDAVPEVDEEDFSAISPGAWLLKTVPWSSAEHQIVALAATGEVASVLDIAPGTACLEIQRKTQNDKGKVTWAKMTYPGDQHSLVASFLPADR